MPAKNRYQGVNAHLMSYFQNQLGYKTVHGLFVAKITLYLNRVLPDAYEAAMDDSLKILQTMGNGQPSPKNMYPDISVRGDVSQKLNLPLSSGAAVPDLVVPAPEIIENKEPLSVAIYERGRAKPVTMIEVLSPGNKIGDENRQIYKQKRYLITEAKIALVEIDFLHQSRSVINTLPVYLDDPNAFPYYIALTDPAHSHNTFLYRFRVDQPIPTINLPLLHGEYLACDFDNIYQETYTEGRYGNRVDYALEPLNFASYAPIDQQKIREVMAKNA